MMKKKNRNLCDSCRWGFDNWCAKIEDCFECTRNIPNGSYTGRCKCLLVKDGEPCADYEKYEGKVETQDNLSADVVEVVRCKDCVYYEVNPYHEEEKVCKYWSDWIYTDPNHFAVTEKGEIRNDR